MEGFRNVKVKTEKPDGPKITPLTNTSKGIEPLYRDIIRHRVIKNLVTSSDTGAVGKPVN